MQELTKKTVAKLLKDTSHVLRVEDFELIEQLDKLAEKVVKHTPEDKRILNQPYEYFGIKFYPLTIAKSMWYAEKCEEWDVDGTFQNCFLFWILTLPLTSDVLDEYSERNKADKAIKSLSRKLHCTIDDMTEIFLKCTGSNGVNQSSGGDANYGALVSIMLREYGGTPDLWLYETPIEKIGCLVEQYISKVNSECDASRSALAHKGKAVAPAQTAKLVALKSFRIKANEIKELWNGR
jgi:hypothetical protein